MLERKNAPEHKLFSLSHEICEVRGVNNTLKTILTSKKEKMMFYK